MVVASLSPICGETIRVCDIPVIDLSGKRADVSELILGACEEFGFFKVINHGVPKEVIQRMEDEGRGFFSRPFSVKQRAGPATPLGYGCKSIGFKGDYGHFEYLLLHADTLSVTERSTSIADDPVKFCCVANDYIEEVREVACEILELLAEGLGVQDKRALSKLIRDPQSDSVFRLNHYPCCKEGNIGWNFSDPIGFGEHSDPQILTLLWSNQVDGLQISPENGVWIPVSPDPAALFVNVGDALQAFTNGRLVSVRHRAMTNSSESRMSIIYFAAPPLQQKISPLSEMLSPQNPSLYRPFTWAEYKKTTYSMRLADTRLQLFKTAPTIQFP